MLYVECSVCGLSTRCYDTEEEAAAAWNQRDGFSPEFVKAIRGHNDCTCLREDWVDNNATTHELICRHGNVVGRG